MEAKASQSAPFTFRPSTQTMTSLALATLMANKKAPGMRRICTKCSATTEPHTTRNLEIWGKTEACVTHLNPLILTPPKSV